MKKSLFSSIKKLPYVDTSITFFSSHLQTVPQNWQTYLDSHLAFELLLVLDGEQETLMNQFTYLLKKGDILLIPPGNFHQNKCVSLEGMTYFTAHFDIDDPFLRYMMMKNCNLIYQSDSEIYNEIREVIDKWIMLYKNKEEYSLTDKLTIMEQLIHLFSTFTKIEEQKEEKDYSVQALKTARIIADLIQSNFNAYYLHPNEVTKEIIQIKNIYKKANVSMSYGLEVFRKVYHLSPKEYLNGIKLKEAKRLLQHPDTSLENISYRLGYENLSHFSRQFKKWTGETPNQFRRKNSR